MNRDVNQKIKIQKNQKKLKKYKKIKNKIGINKEKNFEKNKIIKILDKIKK